MLAKKVRRARKLRRLDPSRDTKSLQLYHHILWLSREGLAIVELDVLPYTQNGEQGAECRVMSCKLRASFYHIFCLFHNNPPVSTLSVPSQVTLSSDPPGSSPQKNGQRRSSNGKNGSSRHGKKASLRDAIPSLQSDISYITNPYALTGATPPPQSQSQQAPSRPPGLPPKPPIPSSTAFILPPLNFLPITTSAFTTTTSLASSLLPGSHPLRLSVALEHSAFLWDCAKEYDRSRRVARRAIAEVWRAEEGMDDMEFADARDLVSILGTMMTRGLRRDRSTGENQGARDVGVGSPSGGRPPEDPPFPSGSVSRPRDPAVRPANEERAAAEEIEAARRGNEGAWLASASSSPSARAAATSSRRSPGKENQSSSPRRSGSSGSGASSATPRTTPAPPRTSSLRGPSARQDKDTSNDTPPRSTSSTLNAARRSPPMRQTSYGTNSTTPRPPTAIRDSPHLRPPTAGREKELPPTPEEWSRVGYLGEPRPTTARAGAHGRTPPSAATPRRGGSAASHPSTTPQQRTPPSAVPQSSRTSQEVHLQTPERASGDRRSGGTPGGSGSRSGGSGSKSGASSSNTRGGGGTGGQRGSGGSTSKEATSSQTTPRSGGDRRSGESRPSPGPANPRGTQRGGGKSRWF